ncbi:MAG TPA: hypothetical protein VGM75_20960 [Pseudonocardiaceae bacterium]|jgi:hypothetical protein
MILVGEKQFTGHHQEGVGDMSVICSLPKAARIVMWLTILSALFGLILGYQAGSPAANPAGTGQPAATAPANEKN